MPLVKIQATRFSADQKRRIGDRIIHAFHSEGVPPGSVVILFDPVSVDILLDGGYLIEPYPALQGDLEPPEPAPRSAAAPGPAAPGPAAPGPAAPGPAAPMPAAPGPMGPAGEGYKTRARRTKAELAELKAQLVSKLQMQGALSSYQAQEELGLRDCEWAPGTLRRFFFELEEAGAIVKQGQKRGTRYVWQGITSQNPSLALPKLVKRSDPSEDPPDDPAEDPDD